MTRRYDRLSRIASEKTHLDVANAARNTAIPFCREDYYGWYAIEYPHTSAAQAAA